MGLLQLEERYRVLGKLISKCLFNDPKDMEAANYCLAEFKKLSIEILEMKKLFSK